MRTPLSPEKEQEAQALAAKILRDSTTIIEIARLLVSTLDEKLFGDTELDVRDLVLGLSSQSIEDRLEKKRLRWLQYRLPEAPKH